MYRNKKKLIIIIMCVTILLMAAGYAAFSTVLKINGTTSIASEWKVVFTKIEEVSRTKGLYYTSTNTEDNKKVYYFRGDVENNYVKFEENRYQKNCKYNDMQVYDTTFENAISKEDCTSTNVCNLMGTPVVGFDEETCNQTFESLLDEMGVSSANCQYNGKAVFKMDLETEQPIEPTETECISNYVCDTGALGVIGIDEETCQALGGKWTNDKGIYEKFHPYTNEKASIVNEHLITGSHLWRIVRINEDESIRLIYQSNNYNGIFFDGSIIMNASSDKRDDNAYVGYMYGTIGANGNNAYELTHSNLQSNVFKETVDHWYKEYMLNVFDDYLSDTGFCNDRSISSKAGLWSQNDTALGYGKEITYYGAYNRLVNLHKPQFKCPNEDNDLFTTNTANKGNKALEYPVGLITADELVYAGASFDKINLSFYLKHFNNPDLSVATMTPYGYTASTASFQLDRALMFGLAKSGRLQTRVADNVAYTLPVINLKSSVEILSGNGTYDEPYTLSVNTYQ